MKLAEIITESNLLKKLKRAVQGWPDTESKEPGLLGKRDPKSIVKRQKSYDDDQLKKMADVINKYPPQKHSPAGLQKRVVDREIKKRGLDKE